MNCFFNLRFLGLKDITSFTPSHLALKSQIEHLMNVAKTTLCNPKLRFLRKLVCERKTIRLAVLLKKHKIHS